VARYPIVFGEVKEKHTDTVVLNDFSVDSSVFEVFCSQSILSSFDDGMVAKRKATLP
jgi:hypothetical protein